MSMWTAKVRYEDGMEVFYLVKSDRRSTALLKLANMGLGDAAVSVEVEPLGEWIGDVAHIGAALAAGEKP